MLIPQQPPLKHNLPLKSNYRSNSNDINPSHFSKSPQPLPKMSSRQKLPPHYAPNMRIPSLPSQYSSVSSGLKTNSAMPSMNMIKDEVIIPLASERLKNRGTVNTQISNFGHGYKVMSPVQTTTSTREDMKPSPRKSRIVQRDTVNNSAMELREAKDPKEQMKASRSQILKTTALSTFSKKTKVAFGEHVSDLPVIDENRLKKLNMGSIKEFSDKYLLKYSQGYGNQLLEKCINLLATEHDPFVLENLFPGQYSMYITLDTTTSSPEFTKLNSKVSYNSIEGHFDSLNAPSHSNNNGGFLPSIRTKRSENLNIETDSQGPASRSSIYNSSRFSAMSSVLGSKKFRDLPRMDIETFKESLYFYKDFAHKSVLLLIEATYKEANLQAGFIELLWDESKNGSICISKFFVQKVYRKMGLMIPVTVKALDHLFKTYKIDRLTMEMLPGNETILGPLSLIGFKYEKMFYKNGQKWQNYALKKKDFYQFFQDVVGLPADYVLESNFRSVPKGW